MIIGKQDIIQLYELYYSKKYSNNSYKFKPSAKADKLIESFINYLDLKYKIISIGQHFIGKYFTFQFKRLENQVFKRFSSKDVAGRIQIYDILGKKAIEYWENRDIKFDFLIEPYVSGETDSMNSNRAEEIEKQRFYNSQRGFLNCLEKTSLYNNSSMCILCKFKIECKKMLKSNYLEIYNERGYATT